jgi:hypothetical protein
MNREYAEALCGLVQAILISSRDGYAGAARRERFRDRVADSGTPPRNQSDCI